MILTLHKLLQKARQVSDPRDAHALALDLVESMLRHYAVVAIRRTFLFSLADGK
jgi:hypothetical protein